jgi:hypothetical protein
LVAATVTGSGSVVLATSPTLVTPNLGTPSAATLTNATGLPVSTGISGLGTGVATALGVNVGSAGSVVVNNVAATLSFPGAASTPGLLVSGAHFTGGSGTTTFPQLLVQDSTATASTVWSTSGTSLGVNSHTGIGNIIDLQLDGVSQFKVNGTGNLNTLGSITIAGPATTFTWSAKGILSSPAVGNIQLGAVDVNGSPVAQTLSAQSAITGTDLAGAAMLIKGSRGTGAGSPGSVGIQTGVAGSTGATQSTLITALLVDNVQHVTLGGTTNPPTCGTGCSSIAANSTDQRMTITTGAAVTAVTVNFGKTWVNNPVCVVSTSNSTDIPSISAISTTAFTVTLSAVITGTVYAICQ